MKTLAPTRTSVSHLNDLLHVPVEAIDFPFFENAVHQLRSRADEDLAAAVSHLGRNAIDVSGTGGSGIAKFNTSTATAFILASHDVKTIKFGNRSITGRSGSIDFLAALGFVNDVGANEVERIFEQTNLLFLNAQSCYQSFASIREQRKSIGRPTIFNFVGPLLNPARPAFRLMGISNAHMQMLTEQFFKQDASVQRAITVRSESGLDEIVPGEENTLTFFDRSRRDAGGPSFTSHRSGQGCPRPQASSHMGPEENARAFISIVEGNDTSSFNYHSLVVNAGAAFVACRAVTSVDKGTRLAKKLLAKNLVRLKFDQLRSTLS